MPKQKRITVERNIKLDTDSQKYYVTFYYGKDELGRARRKTKSFDDLKEARLALQTHELAVEQDLTVKPSKFTLNEAVNAHIEMLRLKLEESTIYGYKTIIKHISAHPIGGKQVQSLKPTDIQKYLLYLQTEKNLSSNTALKHYNFLNAVFNILEQQETVLRNPVKRVVIPKKVKHQADFLTVEEARRILDRVQGDRLEIAFTIGLYTGMRRGEICGLKWDAVDFEKNTIQVRLNRVNVGAEIVEKAPKSESSERTINMVPELRESLLTELTIQQQNKELLKEEFQTDGYVICFPNGEPIRPNYLSEMFKAWFDRKENADLHAITPHELRHSFVALAIAAGVPLYEISQALGHGDIGITSRTYAHLLDSSHINATESMAGLLRKDT